MIILEKPYVSETLVDSIVRNDFVVLENETLDFADVEEGAFRTITSEDAKAFFENQEYPLIYSNSESAINWVLDNLPESNLARYIKLFKDKVQFREMLKDIYPDFYYREVAFEELEKISLEELRFPLVLKPSVGFLSFGVHTINSDEEWKQTIAGLAGEMKSVKDLYPERVVNASKFIIEQYVEGDEFAIDAYFDEKGNPDVLNVYKHPFLNSKDVKDRIYLITSVFMLKYMSRFAFLLKQIGEKNDIKNFALHLEVRITKDDEIIPIEVNPMRFAGWCTTDVTKYAWGIDVYECFLNKRHPNWNELLMDTKRGAYYFSMAEVPAGFDRNKIKHFDYDKYLSNFSNVLEVRRINYKTNPLFAIIFGYTEDNDEIGRILELNTKDFIEMS